MPESDGEEKTTDKKDEELVTGNSETSQFDFRKGKWWPATIILVIPFVFIVLPLYRAIRHEMNGRATLATILLFEAVMLFAEHFSLGRGHWVWNDSRILGWRIWGIPIEEPLLYYWFGPFLVITIMLAVRRAVRDRRKP